MRINEFARAGRTTPRAVRHYHQIGLLAEPSRLANGYRDYTLADLARLLRITWLSRAGVPLKQIAQLDSGDRADARRELEEVAAAVAAERDRLNRQYDALRVMIEAAEQGRELTALPVELGAALDRVAQQAADDETTQRVIEADRTMLEVMALTGDLAGNLADVYLSLVDDPEQLRSVLATARAFGELEGQPVTESQARIDEVVDMFLRTPAVLESLAGDVPQQMPEEDAAFYLPDPAQREVVRRLLLRIGRS